MSAEQTQRPPRQQIPGGFSLHKRHYKHREGQSPNAQEITQPLPAASYDVSAEEESVEAVHRKVLRCRRSAACDVQQRPSASAMAGIWILLKRR